MVEDLINALRRIAKISYGATIEEARSVGKTQREAADLIEQQAARIAVLEQELRNIANADTVAWDDPSQFEAWAKSRARHTLARIDKEK
ncbi:hypothetical protein [Paraburkholderia gardini]|uniref:hypothetical protein n=1 Tax=Paraburkholderia gardini TaxID=2823469 RepID=UPI001DC3CFB7|nr:hypothetical protein [Paraburkholderia gardini]CAG4889587.1 hypothetical protein R69919_00777 [Paraburkholderia gardini]